MACGSERRKAHLNPELSVPSVFQMSEPSQVDTTCLGKALLISSYHSSLLWDNKGRCLSRRFLFQLAEALLQSTLNVANVFEAAQHNSAKKMFVEKIMAWTLIRMCIQCKITELRRTTLLIKSVSCHNCSCLYHHSMASGERLHSSASSLN